MRPIKWFTTNILGWTSEKSDYAAPTQELEDGPPRRFRTWLHAKRFVLTAFASFLVGLLVFYFFTTERNSNAEASTTITIHRTATVTRNGDVITVQVKGKTITRNGKKIHLPPVTKLINHTNTQTQVQVDTVTHNGTITISTTIRVPTTVTGPTTTVHTPPTTVTSPPVTSTVTNTVTTTDTSVITTTDTITVTAPPTS